MTTVSVQIPGKVMLAGEYSVLYGGRALAATVKNQMTVTVSDHESGKCRLTSNLWDDVVEFATDSKPDASQPPLLVSALSGIRRYHIGGASIDVTGDLSPEFGFGSSSALRLGTQVALKTYAEGHEAETYWEEATEAWRLQRNAQRRASGYDIVTQYLGGLTLFSPGARSDGATPHWPGPITVFPEDMVRRLNQIVHIFVGGKGAPTSETVQGMTAWLEERHLTGELVRLSENLITKFLQALKMTTDESLTSLNAAVAAHRALFAASPSYPAWLDKTLGKIPGVDSAFSYKTTGAGGEDAVLLIGADTATQKATEALEARGWRQVRRPFTSTGTSVYIDEARA